MRASDQIASLNEELRIARAALERAEAERAEAKYWWDKIRADNEALRAELAAAKQAAWGDNGRTKIFDHKWLDPQCIAMGCQSLILRAALVLAEAEKIKLQNSFSEGRTQLMAEIAKAQAAMCQKALYKSESDRLRDELAAAQEIKKMDDFNLSQHKMVTMDRFHKIQRLEAELAAVREALEWYADQNNWKWSNGRGFYASEVHMIMSDQGHKARTALQNHRIWRSRFGSGAII